MGRLHVKFHEDRCKGEAVMRLKPFYLTAQSLHCDLDLWPFDPKVHRAHTWLMGRLHVKFHEDRCKGEAFMRLKPFYLTARLQTDGRTDGQGDSSIPPPNFVAGGIIMQISSITKIQDAHSQLSKLCELIQILKFFSYPSVLTHCLPSLFCGSSSTEWRRFRLSNR